MKKSTIHASTPFHRVAQGLEDGYQKPGVDGLWFLCSFLFGLKEKGVELKKSGAFPPNPNPFGKLPGAYIICLP